MGVLQRLSSAGRPSSRFLMIRPGKLAALFPQKFGYLLILGVFTVSCVNDR